ncbi:MAG: hypothetical protein ILP09_08595, partial [Oscillospiraceae bacterium]|nr:hypothetical protein [Oscillospiraceae bacterium]
MKELFQKRTGWLPLLMSSLLTSSVFFFFGPLRMYMSHITKLWFSLRDIFVPTAAMCLIAAALLFGLGMLLFKSRKLFRVYIGFLFAVGIMLFVQGCIIPDRYGVLTGSIFTRKQYIDRVITNTDIWLCAIIASFILGKILKKHFGTVVAAVSACVMLAQFIMLVGLYVKTDFGEKTDSSPYLSSKNLYSLSGEQNIVVLVADGFDQASFLKIMDEDPRRMEKFDGFTVFDNMTGEYPDAKGALPFILTGRYYENAEPYPEYIDLAWEEAADYYADLKSEGYRIGIYTQDTEAVSDGAGDMIDNLIFAEIGTSSAAALEKDLVQLTAMRFFPDALKEYVWSGRELFDDAKTTEEGQYPRYSSDIKDCRDMLVSGGLTADEKQPVYHVVHLETVLTGADAAEAEENGHGSAAMTRAEGYLSVLEEFFGRLKELGIYDRTMIVITGGHGSEEVKSNPVMLAKDFGKRDAPVISHAPVSHKNIFAAVTDAPEYEERYGKSLFGAGENDGGERRYFLYPLGGETLREDYLPDMTEYYILPDGSGPENYRLSGKIHTREGVVEKTPYAAKTGEAVAFGSGEAIAHFVSGISAVSEKYTDKNGRERSCSRALGNSGRACFDFEENAQALFCRIELCDNMPDGGQRFVVKAKDTVLFDGKVSNDMPYADFLIPEQCFDYELLMLDFEYPEERYYPSLKEDISIAFAEIFFKKAVNTDRIDLTRYGDSSENVRSGWHGQEDAWRWTEKKASLQVLLGTVDAHMSVRYWTHPGAEDTSVYLNGKRIGVLPHHEEGDGNFVSLPLPKEYRRESGADMITFITEGATSSKEYYGSEDDDRVLGIAVSEIRFTKPEYTRRIDCAAGGNSSAYLLSDWHGQEEAWRWSGERSSVQVVPGAE